MILSGQKSTNDATAQLTLRLKPVLNTDHYFSFRDYRSMTYSCT